MYGCGWKNFTMRKTIYLHIGFHKTGTSSIQHYLNKHSVFLRRQGLLYPSSVITGNNQSILATSIKDIYRNDDTLNPHYEKVNQEIGRHTGDIIISSECFMEGVNPYLVKNLLGSSGDVIKVVIYVRPQIQWVESLYGEIIKDSSRRCTGSIESLREIHQGKLNYLPEIEQWSKCFGSKNIIIRKFVKSGEKGNLISDFFNAINYRGSLPFDLQYKNSIQNPAFDPRCLEFLRRANNVAMPRELHIKLTRELSKISEAISNILGKTSMKLVSRNEIERLKKKWHDDLGFPNNNLPLQEGNLPFNELPEERFEKEKTTLTAKEEHWIFDCLSHDIQKHLSNMSPRIKTRIKGESFMPITPTDEVARLRSIIGRMRTELNWIYT